MKKLSELQKLVDYAGGDYLLIIFGNAWEVQFHQTTGEDTMVVCEISNNLAEAIELTIKKVKEYKHDLEI